MNILITGVAGFIGMAIAKKVLERGDSVIGIDNLNSFYDTKLKKDRIKILKRYKKFKFYKVDILSINIEKIFKISKPHIVLHLAAQPGVRYSLINPHKSANININGFLNIIELSKIYRVKNFIYASSSSVYGLSNKLPYNENAKIDTPASLYAATKKSNELFAHAYSNNFNMQTTGIRFFTVYGPWGRPDMAAMSFIKNILNNKYIDVYNQGNMSRDFTYIDDIVNGTISIIYFDFKPKKSMRINSNFNIFNLGNSKSIKLMKFINILEKNLNKKAKINFLPMHTSDVKNTHADISLSNKVFNYQPKVDIKIGLKNLVNWYLDYYKYE